MAIFQPFSAVLSALKIEYWDFFGRIFFCVEYLTQLFPALTCPAPPPRCLDRTPLPGHRPFMRGFGKKDLS